MHYPKPTTQMDYVGFCFKDNFYMLHKIDKCIGIVSIVIKEDWIAVCKDVKNNACFLQKVW